MLTCASKRNSHVSPLKNRLHHTDAHSSLTACWCVCMDSWWPTTHLCRVTVALRLKVASSYQTVKSGEESQLTCKNHSQNTTGQSWVMLVYCAEQSWLLQFPLLMPQNISTGFRETDLTWPSPLENVWSPVTQLQHFHYWTARSSRWALIITLHCSISLTVHIMLQLLPMLFVFHIHFSNISVPCSHSSFFTNTAESPYIAQTVVLATFSLTLVTTIRQSIPVLSVMLVCPLASFKIYQWKIW